MILHDFANSSIKLDKLPVMLNLGYILRLRFSIFHLLYRWIKWKFLSFFGVFCTNSNRIQNFFMQPTHPENFLVEFLSSSDAINQKSVLKFWNRLDKPYSVLVFSSSKTLIKNFVTFGSKNEQLNNIIRLLIRSYTLNNLPLQISKFWVLLIILKQQNHYKNNWQSNH